MAATSGKIPCGTSSCAAGQACCKTNDKSVCTAVEQGPPPPQVQSNDVPTTVLASTIACASKDSSDATLVLCTNSLQCPDGAVCVSTSVFAESLAASYCEDSHDVVLGTPEVCVRADKECRTPNTRCVAGACWRKDRAVACGKKSCGPTQVCGYPIGQERDQAGQCIDAPKDGWFADSCDGPEDCLPGQSCCAGMVMRCMDGCAGGDTPVPVCADHTRCADMDPEVCRTCGAYSQ